LILGTTNIVNEGQYYDLFGNYLEMATINNERQSKYCQSQVVGIFCRKILENWSCFRKHTLLNTCHINFPYTAELAPTFPADFKIGTDVSNFPNFAVHVQNNVLYSRSYSTYLCLFALIAHNTFARYIVKSVVER
jgi:hypothetical protein